MNLQFYHEKISESDEFQKFMNENKNAYMCSGFFVIDKEGKDSKQHFDYFIPEDKRAFSFQSANEGVKIVQLESFGEKTPEEIQMLEVDFDETEQIILEEMKNNKLNNKIQKILISLQRLDGKETLLCTVFITMMGIVRLNIDLQTKKAEGFEKKSFFDILQVVKKDKK